MSRIKVLIPFQAPFPAVALLWSLIAFHPVSVWSNDNAFEEVSGGFAEAVISDYRLHYSKEKLTHLALVLGLTGVVANTEADLEFRDYYQKNIRSDQGDHVMDAFDSIGDASIPRYSVAIYLGAALLGGQLENAGEKSKLREWGVGAFRALLLGAPQRTLLARATGSGRPTEGDSHWRFFDDNNGVSGHAFYGAVPFITAANMADSRALKHSLYAASILPGLARINNDKHYLSQVVLGWSLAYMAGDTVARTRAEKAARVSVLPVSVPGGVELVVQVDW